MNNVMIIAAHPDDEWLGCGGSILKHISEGDKVQAVFISDGFTSRKLNKTETRNQNTIKLMNQIGAEKPIFFEFPDNKLDTIPLLDVVQRIEEAKRKFSPNIVFTHFADDLNIDHRVTCNAVFTAFRPTPNEKLIQLNHFEVLSSTDWNPEKIFRPNYFINISKYLENKLDLLSFYEDEMRDFPHTRSYENVKNLAKSRGSSIGIEAAEAFFTSRMIKS